MTARSPPATPPLARVLCLLFFGLLGCATDGSSTVPDGGAAAAGSGGSAGRGGASSCANPDMQSCKQGTTVVGVRVMATGFDSSEGAPVVAVLVESGQVLATSSSSVSGGRFDLDLYVWGTCASVGQKTTAGGALFVDADGDGVCDPSKDLVFVWPTGSSMNGQCSELSLSPASPRCSLGKALSDAEELTAAKAVCPAIGGCIGFCGAGGTGAGGASVICGAVDGGAG